MPQRLYQRAREIVGAALLQPAEVRAAFLDRACAGDPELRAEIDSLLAHAANPPDLVGTAGAAAALTPTLLEAMHSSVAAPMPHELGPYRLTRLVGEGGMGNVYEAEQTEPFCRTVAVKVIRRGLDTDRIVRRFEAERQTLARMDHPAIARVLDAGTTGYGRPYFVMEFVDGAPITTSCADAQLTTAERLRLFLAVCAGVQHAHQKGIVHRDLKPSNILVRTQDGALVPRIIDFGIAKAVAGDAGDLLSRTQPGFMVGTPEYSSPEQAGVIDADIDTRSDVYSLGVVLYELLTGQRPYDFQSATPPEIQRVIALGPPPRPSLATRRPELAGDLDNILLKAMARLPDERYSSVEQLADDLRRHLDGLPVQARGATWHYRTSKFVRRHRTGVALSVAALLALVVFAGTMTWQRDRARAAEQQAAREAATARQVSAFLTGLFRQADPFVAQGGELDARTLLDQGADRMTRELAGQPDVQSALLATMSQAYTGLRVPDRAVALADESLRLARAHHGARHPAVAASLVALAAAHAAGSEPDRAMPLYREALDLQRALLPADAPAILETTSLLAANLHTVAQFAEAEALYRDALAITRRTRPEDHADVTAALQHLGGVLHAQGKTDEARAVLEDALVRARRAATNPVLTADILSELAVLLKNQGLAADAESMYREALAIRERTFGDHPVTAQSHNNLGVFLRGLGQEARALEHLHRALAIHRTAFGERHLETGIAHANLASVLKALDRAGEAEREFQAALASIEAAMGRRYWVYGQIAYNYGLLLRDTGRVAAAAPLMVRGYEVVRDGLGADSRRALTMADGVAQLHERLGQPDVAASYRRLLPRPEGTARE